MANEKSPGWLTGAHGRVVKVGLLSPLARRPAQPKVSRTSPATTGKVAIATVRCIAGSARQVEWAISDGHPLSISSYNPPTARLGFAKPFCASLPDWGRLLGRGRLLQIVGSDQSCDG
jgi:hypothetical protein